MGDSLATHSPDMNLIKDDQFKFLPGILKNGVNKEDQVVTNDEFSLRLGSVKTDQGSLFDQELEKHYDWTKLEKLILHHLGKFYRSKY